jgi:hypothetical protein
MQYGEYGDVQLVMNDAILVFPGMDSKVQISSVVIARI